MLSIDLLESEGRNNLHIADQQMDRPHEDNNVGAFQATIVTKLYNQFVREFLLYKHELTRLIANA